MKKRYIVLIAILIAAGSFLAGSWFTYQGARSKATVERKILHYVDPMNPAFKSDKPGIAPCGMPLEPVYADQGGAAAGGSDLRASLPPGTIRISLEKQQLIGVKTSMVEKAPWSHTLRVLGRVTPDETRTYRINAAVSGWIEKVMPVTTGSLVKKNDLLATFSFYATDYRVAVQSYFNYAPSELTGPAGGKGEEPADQKIAAQIRQKRSRDFESIRLTGRSELYSQSDYYRQIILSYGISEAQLEEMRRTRTILEEFDIRSPTAGFLLLRRVNPQLRFERGQELFRVADLSRVWILADIFETEASYFKPGMRVKMELPYQKRTLYAEVSPVLPEFDPATRTLKVRLEADNPGYVMRPDMFVNVEFPVSGAPAIIVPVDAVLDSGLKKTVFVDRGNGFFEPRQVETGRLLGERVEISRGLMPGEKIVVSGNFLIDSEARMQQAASGIFGRIGRDLVCGMNIDKDRARAEGNFLEYQGQTYFFCDSNDREEFRRDPERYLKSAPTQGTTPMVGSQGVVAKPPSHTPAAAPKQQGAKTVREAHDSMTMPGAQSPAVMPGMPAASAKTQSKAEGIAIQSAAAPGMGPQSPSSPAPGPGDMPMPGPPGTVPMPGGKAGEMIPPVTDAPGMNQGPPAFPTRESMPGPMSREAAPMSGMQTGEIAPPVPTTRTPARTPRMNPRLQRYLLPGTAPQAGPSGASPMPGGKAGEMPPPATDNPGEKR